jgi:uncharacterized DUF497 family protein
MKISYDPAKRLRTLQERALDFEDARIVFAGLRYVVLDDRFDYGEVRWVTYGLLQDRLVAVVWTPRGTGRHVISMRKCNDREKEKYQARLA